MTSVETSNTLPESTNEMLEVNDDDGVRDVVVELIDLVLRVSAADEL